MNDDLTPRAGHMPLKWFHRGTSPKAAIFPDDAAGEGGAEVTEAAVLAALDYTPAKLALGNYATFTSDGLPGSYTLAKSGIVVKNAAGTEVFRIWGTDPDFNNYNGQNLFVGYKTGDAQHTDNSSAGFFNNGFGSNALLLNETSVYNNAFGTEALTYLVSGAGANSAFGNNALYNTSTGSENSGFGMSAGHGNITGTKNTCVGSYANVATGALTNATAVGAYAAVDASNKIRLGDANVTLVETAGAMTASAYKVGATAGIDFSGAVTNITVVKGIITAAS